MISVDYTKNCHIPRKRYWPWYWTLVLVSFYIDDAVSWTALRLDADADSRRQHPHETGLLKGAAEAILAISRTQPIDVGSQPISFEYSWPNHTLFLNLLLVWQHTLQHKILNEPKDTLQPVDWRSLISLQGNTKKSGAYSIIRRIEGDQQLLRISKEFWNWLFL